MNANDAELLPEIISAIRAFTCATTTEAEQAAAAILRIFDDPPDGPENVCPECNGAGEISTYSSDPASPVERCFECNGTGEIKCEATS